MVTFKMDPFTTRAEATICICIVDSVMLDRRVGLDYLELLGMSVAHLSKKNAQTPWTQGGPRSVTRDLWRRW
jgi:hypothetical protein